MVFSLIGSTLVAINRYPWICNYKETNEIVRGNQ